jgi:hypothetical protein
LGISCIYLSLYLSLDLLIPRIIILISKVVSNVVVIKVATFIIRMSVGLSKGLLRPRQSKAARFTMMKLGEVRLSEVKRVLRLLLSQSSTTEPVSKAQGRASASLV